MKEDTISGRRLCDYCGSGQALLYCRADSAKLCLRCDREVHSTNPLFAKHARSLLCDLCDASSASIFCESHRHVLCSGCDWDAHDGNATHNRRPVEAFSGCPSASEILAALGFDDSKGVNDASAGFADSLLWETPTFVSLDDLIASSEDYDGFRAFDVPPLPKNRNTTCGKHKEEILRQIRLLARSEAHLNSGNVDDFKPVPDARFLDSEPNSIPGYTFAGCEDHGDPFAVPDHEAVAFQWLCDDLGNGNRGSNSLDFLSSNNDGKKLKKQHEVDTLSSAHEFCEGPIENTVAGNSPVALPRAAQYDLNSQERESAISRYKEKRKTRRYDKHIRYESRKARAESRTRIRGRFAKVDHHP